MFLSEWHCSYASNTSANSLFRGTLLHDSQRIVIFFFLAGKDENITSTYTIQGILKLLKVSLNIHLLRSTSVISNS